MARDLDADELPSDLGGSDSQDFNDELTSLHGAEELTAETQAVVQQERHDESMEMLEGLRAIQGAETIRWKIYRIKSENPDADGYLEEISTARLSMDYLRDTYGSGVYRIRGQYLKGGKFAAQRTVVVAKGAKKREAEMSVAPQSGFDLQAFFAQQNELDRQRRQEQEDREEKRRRERNELISILAPALAPVLAAVVGNKGPDIASLLTALKPAPQPSMLELMQTLQAMKELDGGQPQEDAVDKALKLVDVLRDAGGLGDGEGKTGLWDILKETIKQVGPGAGQALGALAQAMQQRQMRVETIPPAALPAPLPRAPQPLDLPVVPASATPASATLASAPLRSAASPLTGTGANASPRADSSPSAPMGVAGTAGDVSASPAITPQKAEAMGLLDLLPFARHLPWLKGHVENLIVRAARGSNPELYAELMLDDFPDNADVRVLGSVLARVDWFNLLSQLDVRVRQYEGWFSQFRIALLTMIQEETGVSFGIQTPGGTDSAGRPIVNVRGPGEEAPLDPAHEQNEESGFDEDETE